MPAAFENRGSAPIPAIGRIARATHVVSAAWVLVLAVIIFIDVCGRYFFGLPLLGATEIIKNSVVSITFLQLPLAIYRNGMIRTTLLYDHVGSDGQRLLRTFMNLMGLLFFVGTAFSAWGPAIEALGVSEYEGEGALRVPTYPVRFLVIVTSLFAAYVYCYLIYLDWTGRLEAHERRTADA
jgi:TRAP-type C4-dicarboxylate transport system permease small subunit